jgi:hypothetical protein
VNGMYAREEVASKPRHASCPGPATCSGYVGRRLRILFIDVSALYLISLTNGKNRGLIKILQAGNR